MTPSSSRAEPLTLSPSSGRRVRPFGRVGLVGTSFSSAGDGVAYVGRLLRHALSDLAEEVLLVELDTPEFRPISLPRRGAFIAQLAEVQAQQQPDWWMFVHCDVARVQYALAPQLRRPFAVFMHGSEVWTPRLNRARSRVLQAASVRLANSRHTARRAVAAHPELGIVEVCPLALLPDPPAGEIDRALLERVGSGYALIVGRMNADERYKGHDALFDAWPTVSRAAHGARLVVVGGGDDVERLQERAAALGLGQDVHFAGLVSDATLATLRQRAAFFVMPSTNEGFGLVYLEAMRDGLACIGCTGDAAAEIIIDNQTGLLVAPGSVEALAAAVTRLFIEADFARRLGVAGRTRAEREYTLSRFQHRVATALHGSFGASSPRLRRTSPSL